ncbi:MAG TPA: tetratricopeptide repeat protein [Candidatus Udaeobacter sp.]|jgi:adenylate cyclase
MPKTRLTHHLVALWFADIAGYSERAAEDERGALQLIEILQTLSRETVRRHDGRIVKFMGDAVLAEFPSIELAVRAAAALSKKYVEQSAGTGRAHNLRVGVHIADVAVSPDGDLYGDGVNAAARVQEAAEPGQVVLSQDVWRQLRGRAEFQFESLGDRSLKGVGTIGLYVVTLKEPATKRQPASAGAELTQSMEERKGGIRSIAVLPFADLSAQHDQEYFSDGVAEEILNALTKVAGLHVPARTSCFAFRGTSVDAREIGTRLGVETFLEGSIRKAGNRVRIIVQLVDAENGYHLWSERFDREIENIFAIQDEIARSVLDALGLSLTEREERRFLKAPTTNVQAYEFYLRGRKLFQTWNRQNMEFARQMFARAVAIDPDFALAWAGLAITYVDLYRWGRNSRDLEEAKRTSAHALKLDPNLAEAHVAIGQALAIQRQFKDAATKFERAIELDPTSYDAYYFYARSSFEAGDLEKAVGMFEKAHRSRPEDYQAIALRALALHELGRPDEAREADQQAVGLINKYLEIDPNEARAYSLGANSLARLGEREPSKQWSEQAVALAPNDPVILYNAACNLAQLGEHESALDGLERSIEAGVEVRDWIKHDPDFEPLRDHPRFQAIVKRIAPSQGS